MIVSFSATPPTIRAGQSATLSWVTQGAISVVIDQGVGAQPASKSITVSPAKTTTYSLTASNTTGSATATATVTVVTAPNVVIGSLPAAMIQTAGTGGATTTYTLTNAGGAATTVSLSQSGNFFTQSPTSFNLPAGASQIVTLTGIAQPGTTTAFEGASIPMGTSVAAGLQIPVRLLSVLQVFVLGDPTGPPHARAAANRVDVGGGPTASPSGSVAFTNDGEQALTGILTSDSAWLIPQSGSVTIQPGATLSIPFAINRNKRPDANALVGSASGKISLTYTAAPLTPPSVSTVTVVDTVQISTTTATPPPLAPGEVALFVPGVLGGGNLVSDLTFLNALTGRSINDLRAYYTQAGGVGSFQLAQFPALGDFPLNVADIVKNVFGKSGQVGSLQIRSADAANVLVSANWANSSGGFGMGIPSFRSDRAVAPGDKLFLTGLRADFRTLTDLFIQETAGVGVTVQTEFLAADGTGVGGIRTDKVTAFALTQIVNAVPPGAVSAILTNASGSGAFLAYATPVDQMSGDSWSVVDWSRQYGYRGDYPIVIPVGGALHGANNAYFQTDLAIMNTSSTEASGTLRYISSAGNVIDRPITLAPRQSNILSNVVSALFGFTNDTIGCFVFTPAAGSFAVASRLYSTVTGRPGTYGSGVPAIALSGALRAGSVRAIGSLEDSSQDTVAAGRPATFRTNFGIVEVSGNPVQVRVTLRYSFSGSLTTASGSWPKDYSLGANQFLSLFRIAREILGPSRDSLGDLRSLEADFQVVGGSGAIVAYTWSIDNGTGDSSIQAAASMNAMDPTALCVPNPHTACMLNNRFRAMVRYRGAFDNNAADTDALVKPVTGFASQNYETAFFYFNSPNNIELLLKVLDQGNTDPQGRPTIAVLSGTATPLRTELTITDTQTGITRTYKSDFGRMQGITDFTAYIRSLFPWPTPLASLDHLAASPRSPWARDATPAGLIEPAASVCVPDTRTACLLNGRFAATVRYRGIFDNLAADTIALLKPVTGFASATYETAFFYFNSPNNIELLLKVLDQGNTDSQGRPTIAVLFGSATPLRLELTITDTKTSAVKKYTSEFLSQAGQTEFTAFVK